MRRILLVLSVLMLLGCTESARRYDSSATLLTGGDPQRGKAEIEHHGCASCHVIPGIPGEANVGPSLARVGSRVYLAGVLLNTPDNMIRWIQDPPAVDAKTAMPNLGLRDQELKDVVSYLYTLR